MNFFNGIKKVIKIDARQIIWVKVVQLNSFHGLLESTSFPAFSLTSREPGNEVVLEFVHSFQQLTTLSAIEVQRALNWVQFSMEITYQAPQV